LIFIVLLKILFVVHLKHSSFCPPPDAKPIQNDIPHAMPRQCMSALPLMEQYIFYIFIDYRGHHRKGVAIYNAA
jgi:hypothetical protein